MSICDVHLHKHRCNVTLPRSHRFGVYTDVPSISVVLINDVKWPGCGTFSLGRCHPMLETFGKVALQRDSSWDMNNAWFCTRRCVKTYSHLNLDQLDSLQVLGEIQSTNSKHVNQTDLDRNHSALLSCSASDSGNTQPMYMIVCICRFFRDSVNPLGTQFVIAVSTRVPPIFMPILLFFNSLRTIFLSTPLRLPLSMRVVNEWAPSRIELGNKFFNICHMTWPPEIW